MAHHAYLYAGDQAAGMQAARAYAATVLGLSGADNPDVSVFTYGLLSVTDARRISAFAAQAPAHGDQKCLIIAAGRIFHEAQNAFLKLFEEPSEGTTLVLVVPAEGLLLPTLRSRLIRLPEGGAEIADPYAAADAFLAAAGDARAKLVAKLVARAKSDKDEEKQAVRLEAVNLVTGLMQRAHQARQGAAGSDARALDRFLSDLTRFLPVLHERSVPLKLIFEHLLLVIPPSLLK